MIASVVSAEKMALAQTSTSDTGTAASSTLSIETRPDPPITPDWLRDNPKPRPPVDECTQMPGAAPVPEHCNRPQVPKPDREGARDPEPVAPERGEDETVSEPTAEPDSREPDKTSEPETVEPEPADETEPASKTFTGVGGSLIKSVERPSLSRRPITLVTEGMVPEDIESGELLVSVANMTTAKNVQNQLAPKGYRLLSRRQYSSIELIVLKFRVPKDQSVADAATWVESQFPNLLVDANHVYRLAEGGDSKKFVYDLLDLSDGLHCVRGKIGMVDAPVDDSHPVFTDSKLQTETVLPQGVLPAPADHGTAVASLMIGTNAEYGVSIVPEATLIAVNAFRMRGGSPATNADLILSALDRLMSHSVSVINMSLGGRRNSLIEAAVHSITQKKIPLIAAAGNKRDSGPLYPAAFPEVIAVTAIDANNRTPRNSVRGEYVDFSLPGVDLWTATVSAGSKYHSGSSYAAPLLSGIVLGLLNAQNVGVDDLYSNLVRRSRDLGKTGRDTRYGWGRVSAREICASFN
ncbi:MAG: S8 family serine peptidase [Pseudomonadota bacterium]